MGDDSQLRRKIYNIRNEIRKITHFLKWFFLEFIYFLLWKKYATNSYNKAKYRKIIIYERIKINLYNNFINRHKLKIR